MEVNDKIHASAALPQSRECRFLLNRRLHGYQSRHERTGKEKIPAPVENFYHKHESTYSSVCVCVCGGDGTTTASPSPSSRIKFP
jgi:hypothetical protein